MVYMKYANTMRRSVRPLAALLTLAALCVSCGVVDPVPAGVVLTNVGDATLLALVLERETANVVDPNPRFPVEPDDPRILPPGADRSYDAADIIGGYERGQDLRVFIYEVIAGEAVWEGAKTLTHGEMDARDFRMDIP